MRCAPRLIEVALRDVDHQVRVNAIKGLVLLDRTGLLQDEHADDRKKIARLVYDDDTRIRKAVGDFVKGLWAERVDSLENDISNARVGRKKKTKEIAPEGEKVRLEWKALASLLHDTSDSLEENSAVSNVAISDSHKGKNVMTRAKAAVEALRPHMDQLKNWESLIDYLLLDHSGGPQEVWPLTEEEEDFSLQVLVACIKADDEVRSPVWSSADA